MRDERMIHQRGKRAIKDITIKMLNVTIMDVFLLFKNTPTRWAIGRQISGRKAGATS